LIIQLPKKAKSEEKKETEIKFIGFREYLLTGNSSANQNVKRLGFFVLEAKLILIPELTLTRIKYWLNEYPIVLQNIKISDKQITNKQSYEKTKVHNDEFFNNSQTTLSLFFETCPDKEDWFHKYAILSLNNLMVFFSNLDYHLLYVKVKMIRNIGMLHHPQIRLLAVCLIHKLQH
jgi:hypothetical protein